MNDTREMEIVPETLTALLGRQFSGAMSDVVDMGNTPTNCVRPGPQDGVLVDDHA